MARKYKAARTYNLDIDVLKPMDDFTEQHKINSTIFVEDAIKEKLEREKTRSENVPQNEINETTETI